MAYDKTKMQDIKHSELSLLEQYNALWQNNDIAGMNTFLTEHPELKYKVLNAYNWQRLLNLVRDGETWSTGPNQKITTNATSDSLEGAFATDYNLLVDATVNFKYVGNWQTGTAYKKNNLVKLDEYHAYFCLLNHTASSTNVPPNTTYWVVADEIQGIVGMPIVWGTIQDTIEGDIVLFDVGPGWGILSWGGSVRSFYGDKVWNDNSGNTYLSIGATQYVLNPTTKTWNTKSWGGAYIQGDCVWKVDNDIYHSYNQYQYKLNTDTDVWTPISWNNFVPDRGEHIWADLASNVYYSNGNDQYKLNKSTNTWESVTWQGDYIPGLGEDVWNDGTNVYSEEYKLDPDTMTWVYVSQAIYAGGGSVWKMGNNIYFSNGISQRQFDKINLVWNDIVWGGQYPTYGNKIWTDSTHYYYSDGTEQYVLIPGQT